MTAPLLEVQQLQTVFHTEEGAWPAVSDIDITLQPGEILGLVGESGSGKSVTGFSIFGMIDSPGEVTQGRVLFKGQDLRARCRLHRQGLRTAPLPAEKREASQWCRHRQALRPRRHPARRRPGFHRRQPGAGGHHRAP